MYPWEVDYIGLEMYHTLEYVELVLYVVEGSALSLVLCPRKVQYVKTLCSSVFGILFEMSSSAFVV